jgi:hypothetical protein
MNPRHNARLLAVIALRQRRSRNGRKQQKQHGSAPGIGIGTCASTGASTEEEEEVVAAASRAGHGDDTDTEKRNRQTAGGNGMRFKKPRRAVEAMDQKQQHHHHQQQQQPHISSSSLAHFLIQARLPNTLPEVAGCVSDEARSRAISLAIDFSNYIISTSTSTEKDDNGDSERERHAGHGTCLHATSAAARAVCAPMVTCGEQAPPTGVGERGRGGVGIFRDRLLELTISDLRAIGLGTLQQNRFLEKQASELRQELARARSS